MIIENPDVFKSWLTSILEPLCDADPAALAKYVYALVKKDKPVEELREVMVDQLDVFLQAETKPFVEMLFKSLESNDYLQPREAEKPPTPPPEPEVEKADTETDIPLPAINGAGPCPRPPRAISPPAGRHRVVVSRAPKNIVPHMPPRPALMEHTLVKVMPLTELLEEPVDQPPRRRDRRGEPLRDDRRRRRSRSADRRARPRRHPREPLHEENRRRLSRSPSPRGRYRNRSPPLPDRLSRSRSRSPGPLPRDLERERDRLRPPRDLERDRMSRDREHRERVSRSRDRDRSRSRSRSRSASPRELRADHGDTFKRRCRDFDEKGYCMRGDQCQWDHGHDPVVLEDSALSRVLALPPPVPEYNPLVPDIWMGAPPGFAPFPPPHLPPPRELIHIPRVRNEIPPMGTPPLPPPPRHAAPPHKKNFDYNRLGKGPQRPPPPMHAANCSLEVKKVPRGLNDITHLNNHFCKFGKIVNIQICFGGDPEAALVTFSTPTEASVAYKSTEAVLNNRFIKVFWHNADSKQENMAPAGQSQPKPTERNPGHPGSHNKVLINRDNIKATADIKQNNIEKEKEKQANGEDSKKPSPPPPVAPADKSKRARELLDTQLHQQRRLIQKLESGNLTVPQKNAIMDAINSTQEGIEKLQKELVSYQGTISMKMQEETVARMSGLQLNQVKAKKPKTREEAQKEILDAELDMFTKQQEGQDVTELIKKIDELRRNMTIQFPQHHPAIRRPHSRGGKFNPALRFTRGAARQFPGSASVDHRPRGLLISGFETDELETLYTHFAQYGEVSSKEVDMAVPQLVLQYKVRAHAEQAMLHGKHYNDRTLSITWVSTPKIASMPLPLERAVNGDTPASEPKEESSQTLSTDALLRFEEEEDEEREDRSWRR